MSVRLAARDSVNPAPTTVDRTACWLRAPSQAPAGRHRDKPLKRLVRCYFSETPWLKPGVNGSRYPRERKHAGFKSGVLYRIKAGRYQPGLASRESATECTANSPMANFQRSSAGVFFRINTLHLDPARSVHPWEVRNN